MAVTKNTNLKRYGNNDVNEVKNLQTMLNSLGENLEVDGSYGPATEDAVKKLQNKYGLTVDGIYGTNTQKVLTDLVKNNNTSSTSTSNTYKDNATVTALKTKKDNYGTQLENAIAKGYQPPDIVTQAYDVVQKQLANKPGELNSQWMSYLTDTIKKIENREKFTYDVNGDPLYQQYKDQSTVLGELAMMDTMGQAAAMNGGYGSSYAQSVGQQAYQAELRKLTDKIPELYQLARDQYNQEGQDLYNQFGLYGDMYNKEYTEHRDKVSDWQNMLNYYTQNYQYLDSTEREEYQNLINNYGTLYGIANDNYWNERGFNYTQHNDDRTFNFQTEQAEIANDLAEREMAIKEGDLALSRVKTGHETGDYDLDGKIDDPGIDDDNPIDDGNDDDVTPKETANVRKFIGNARTKDEYLRHHNLKEWEAYIDEKIKAAYGTLDESEIAYLIDYYGV